MEQNSLYIIGIFISFFLVVSILSRLRRRNSPPAYSTLPYKRKKYLISANENNFFQILQRVIGDQYYIFPQIHLDSLLYVEKDTGHWQSFRNKIDRKSVDYVLCDKVNLSPVLVVELNDATHNESKRQERDEFVQEVLEKTGLPLLVVDNSNMSGDELRQKILSKNIHIQV